MNLQRVPAQHQACDFSWIFPDFLIFIGLPAPLDFLERGEIAATDMIDLALVVTKPSAIYWNDVESL